jgi:hypothetical protein
LLLLVCVVVKYAVWIGLAAAAVVAIAVLWKLAGVHDQWLERREKRRGRKQLELAELARRADEQNAQVLAGDERGTYGDYPRPCQLPRFWRVWPSPWKPVRTPKPMIVGRIGAAFPVRMPFIATS